MARKTFQFSATTTTPDGTVDEIGVSFSYPEGRAVALLGLINNLNAQVDQINEAILMGNLDDASIQALVARLGAEDDA